MPGLGGGFKYFLCSSLLGEMIQFDQYFSIGLKPPSIVVFSLGNWILSKWIFFSPVWFFWKKLTRNAAVTCECFVNPGEKGVPWVSKLVGSTFVPGSIWTPWGWSSHTPKRIGWTCCKHGKLHPPWKKLPIFRCELLVSGRVYTILFPFCWGGEGWFEFFFGGGAGGHSWRWLDSKGSTPEVNFQLFFFFGGGVMDQNLEIPTKYLYPPVN